MTEQSHMAQMGRNKDTGTEKEGRCKLLDRNNYAYRVVLKFQDGTQQIQQKSGFRTKKEAENARKRVMGELSNGTYVVNNNVKLQEFLEYWLENEVRQRVGSANTYSSYMQIVKNHIVPYLGRKKLTELNRGDVQKLYKDRPVKEYCLFQIMYLKQFWKRERGMRGTGAVGDFNFWMRTIFVVLITESHVVKIFIGNTIKSF